MATTIKAKAETIEDVTRRMVADPDSWPHWPLLPLKRYTPNVECACQVEISGGGFMLVKANLWAGPEAARKAIAAKEVYWYDTVDDLIADGWIVD
jgi:hypothetical protein